MFSKKKLIHLLAIFFVSLVAIFVHGYQFAVSDQEIFIPYIAKSADPSLFLGDLLFKQPSAGASIFYPVVGFLTRIFNLQVIFFTGYSIFQFIFFLGIFRLAKIILGDDKLAYLSLLPFLLPKFIGGTATSTYEIFFGYRLIGIIALIYYLIFLFEQKYYQAATVAGLGFLFHPLSIIPNLFLLPALALSNGKVKVLIKSLIIFLFLILPSLILARSDFSIFGSAFDREWLSIIKERADYVFPSTWSIRGWAAFALYPMLILIFASKLKKSFSTKIKVIGIVSATIFIISFFLLDVLKIPIFSQFQLARSITPLAYIGLVIVPLFLIYQNRIMKIFGWVAFIALSLNLFNLFLIITVFLIVGMIVIKSEKVLSPSPKIVSMAFLLTIFCYLILNFFSYQNLKNKLQFPKAGNDWIDLQLWAKNNTEKEAIFLVPPDQTGFRIFSHRPIVGDIKDGAVVLYNQSYASAWRERMENLENFQQFKKEDFIRLKAKYQFDYIVAPQSLQTDLPVIFQNQSFIIYKSDND